MSADRIVSSLGEIRVLLKTFNCLDESHLRYGGQSALLRFLLSSIPLYKHTQLSFSHSPVDGHVVFSPAPSLIFTIARNVCHLPTIYFALTFFCTSYLNVYSPRGVLFLLLTAISPKYISLPHFCERQ